MVANIKAQGGSPTITTAALARREADRPIIEKRQEERVGRAKDVEEDLTGNIEPGKARCDSGGEEVREGRRL